MQSTFIDGICDPAFKAVCQALAQNLADGEEIGECVSVVVNGKTVVDLWGGYTDRARTQPLPQPGASRQEIVDRAVEMLTNTAPFDISHHPAMAIPCGMSDGLPVSMMLVGKHFDEPTIYRAAYAFEQAGDWKQW